MSLIRGRANQIRLERGRHNHFYRFIFGLSQSRTPTRPRPLKELNESLIRGIANQIRIGRVDIIVSIVLFSV